MLPADVIAIDILLEPDAQMLAHAEHNNARLRQAFPESFALDAEHRPHITLLQCFVAVADLDGLARAVGAVVRAANVPTMALRAIRYGYTPGPGMGVAGIWIATTPALLQLQADIISAAAPFMRATADIAAFTAGHADPAFDAALIGYVSKFVAEAVGAHFDPHVSTGVAATAYLDAMVAEAFPAFDFAPAGAAMYQLGPFGTAARLLHQMDIGG